MRISTSQIFEAGSTQVQRGQSSLYKLQNQLGTGRRVLTPQDDPVAASRALVVNQSVAVNQQYIDNQGLATSQLGLVDTQLTALSNALLNVRDRVLQAGNTTLSASDRAAIASELEARFGEIMGIANADNGAGEYLFSGYSGKVLPFAIDGSQAAISPATSSPVGYSGDSGERLLQVSASRSMSVSVAGDELFQKIANGNGTFVTSTNGNQLAVPTVNNQGTGIINAGSVLDLQKWQTAANTRDATTNNLPLPLEIRFSTNATTGALEYSIYDSGTGTATTPATYTSGQSISLVTAGGLDFGATVTVSGTPSAGDSFKIDASKSQSLFQTMQNLLGILRSPIGSTTYTSTQYSNDLAGQLTNIDQAMANVSRIQSDIGTKEQELESLGTAASDLAIQYKATLSNLQDLDYNKTISDFLQQQMNLQAAQASFAKISGMSLFNYL